MNSAAVLLRRRWPTYLLLFPVLLAGSILMLIPFAWMVSTAFKLPSQAFAHPVTWWPDPWTLQAFRKIYALIPFGRNMWNSTVVAVSVTVLELLTSSLAASAFARMRFRGRDAIFLFYLASLMIPGQMTLIPNFIIMRKLGLVDTLTSLVLPSAFTALGTFLMRQYFLTLPRELDEAAKIDGAGWFGIYWRVIMPLSGPALATLAILGFMGSWNSFLWPLVMISSGEKRTVTLAVRSFSTAVGGGTYWTELMAASFMALLPILFLFFTLQKYFVRGIATSGLGGR